MKHMIEHSELTDMRTHLTVVMLASSQLRRKQATETGDTARLQDFLDHALTQLTEDVHRIETLLATTDETAPDGDTDGLERPSRVRRLCGSCVAVVIGFRQRVRMRQRTAAHSLISALNTALM